MLSLCNMSFVHIHTHTHTLTLKQDLARPWSHTGDRPGCGQSGSLTMLPPSLTLLNVKVVVVVVVVGTLSPGPLTAADWVGGVIGLRLVAWPYCLVAVDSKARCCTAAAALLSHLLTLAPVSLRLLLPHLPWICPPCLFLSCSLLLSSMFFLLSWLASPGFLLSAEAASLLPGHETHVWFMKCWYQTNPSVGMIWSW